MSKSTKIIAALGVVAGLGVAALPAFTYAADPINGDVQVVVEVEPAIAMQIIGNNDTPDHSAGVTYAEVDAPTGNPSENGYYERSGDAGSYVYTASGDSTVDVSKTYYTQVNAPTYGQAKAYSPNGATTIDGQSLTGFDLGYAANTSSSYVSLLPNAVATDDGTNGFRSTINVWTNNAAGFTLALKDKDADNALNNVKGATIPATASTSLSAGTAAWGYKIFSQGGSADGTTRPGTATGATDWLAVPVSTGTAAEIRNTSTKTDGGDQTIVSYGVATAADQATGIYSDIIVYTATAK